MKQTAVEWLDYQLFIKHGKITIEDIYKAKKMEKEQIENAFNYGQFDLGMEAQEYYKEIYEVQNY